MFQSAEFKEHSLVCDYNRTTSGWSIHGWLTNHWALQKNKEAFTKTQMRGILRRRWSTYQSTYHWRTFGTTRLMCEFMDEEKKYCAWLHGFDTEDCWGIDSRASGPSNDSKFWRNTQWHYFIKRAILRSPQARSESQGRDFLTQLNWRGRSPAGFTGPLGFGAESRYSLSKCGSYSFIKVWFYAVKRQWGWLCAVTYDY